MIIRPCQHCQDKASCKRPAELRAKLKGLSLNFAAISIRCPNYGFPPGARVTVKVAGVYKGETRGGDGYTNFDSPEPLYETGYINGTVMSLHSRECKQRVWLDEIPRPGKDNPVVLVWPANCEALDEPTREVCPDCGCPMGEKQNWYCPTCTPTPEG